MSDAVKEWLEVVDVVHVVGAQQVWKQSRSREGIRACLVRTVESDVVAIAEVGESMRADSFRIKLPRHAQRTQPPFERGGESGIRATASRGVEKKFSVEAGVVRYEH